MNEHKLKELMKHQGISLIGDLSIDERALEWQRAVKIVLRPKDHSDRQCIRNLSTWLIEKCKNDSFDENEVFRRVLDFAIEASGPESRNPYAVFMNIVKKELGYLKNDPK